LSKPGSARGLLELVFVDANVERVGALAPQPFPFRVAQSLAVEVEVEFRRQMARQVEGLAGGDEAPKLGGDPAGRILAVPPLGIAELDDDLGSEEDDRERQDGRPPSSPRAARAITCAARMAVGGNRGNRYRAALPALTVENRATAPTTQQRLKSSIRRARSDTPAAKRGKKASGRSRL
jgi:hypothetical protein